MSGKLTDEAEIVVAMASDWLQLDATDDWIRHDSGIVSSFSQSSDSGLLGHVVPLACRVQKSHGQWAQSSPG
jgi:hypothetical protein